MVDKTSGKVFSDNFQRVADTYVLQARDLCQEISTSSEFNEAKKIEYQTKVLTVYTRFVSSIDITIFALEKNIVSDTDKHELEILKRDTQKLKNDLLELYFQLH